MQRASLVEKSRQKPPERIRVVTDVRYCNPMPVFCFLEVVFYNFLATSQAMKNYCYDDDPLLSACGISVEKQLTQVDGRVLEAPKVMVHFPLKYTVM